MFKVILKEVSTKPSLDYYLKSEKENASKLETIKKTLTTERSKLNKSINDMTSDKVLKIFDKHIFNTGNLNYHDISSWYNSIKVSLEEIKRIWEDYNRDIIKNSGILYRFETPFRRLHNLQPRLNNIDDVFTESGINSNNLDKLEKDINSYTDIAQRQYNLMIDRDVISHELERLKAKQ